MAAHRKDLDDSTIIDLYLQGKSSTEIAKQFGTSHRTILLRLKKAYYREKNSIRVTMEFQIQRNS
jgi:DNA-binding CsgD family transcriptional regulator